MDFEGLDLEKVQESRKAIIKEAIDNDKFDTVVYAALFEIKSTLLKKELVDWKFAKDKSPIINNSIDINELRADRDINVYVMQDKNYSNNKICEELGMWHMPITIKEPAELLVKLANIKKPNKGIITLVDACREYEKDNHGAKMRTMLWGADDYIPNMCDALVLIQLGATIKHISDKYKWTMAQRVNFGRILEYVGIKNTPDKQFMCHPEITEQLLELKKTARFSTIVQHTGFTNDNLRMVIGIDKKQKGSSAVSKKTRIDNRRKVIWDAYIADNGMSISDIAGALDVTRATVSSDIRAYINAHPDEYTEKIKSKLKNKHYAKLNKRWDEYKNNNK